MSLTLRRALGGCLLILLMGFAVAPRLSWGNGPWSVASLYGMEAAAERPLAGASLALGAWWATDRGLALEHGAALLRLENFALLLVAAWGAGRFLRRLLLPWCGRDQARAAGWAVTFIGALHPILLEAATPLAARGDLLGLALGAGAALLFLRGRQERRHGEVLLSGLLVIAASLASPLALFLPLLLALTEATSARRHRPLGLRLRTSVTTLLLFGIGVILEALPRALFLGQSPAQALGRVLASLGREPLAVHNPLLGFAPGLDLSASLGPLGLLGLLGLMVEKLGLLLFPVNLEAVGAGGFGLAGILLLLALQPALVAARSAPRLWGWLIAGWIVSLVVTETARLGVRVEPRDLSAVCIMLAPGLVLATGLGLCSTALSGLRRSVLPALLVLGYAAISHANANGWRGTARRVDNLAQELAEATRLHGFDATYLVVDPMGLRRGHDLVRPALPCLLGGAPPGERTVVAGVEREALFAALATEEFAAARRRGLVLLLPPTQGTGSRRILKVPAAEPGGAMVWREEGRSPQGVRPDPFEVRALRVVARAAGTGGELGAAAPDPVMHWRGQGATAAEGSLAGVWLKGEHGPVALFDLAGEIPWLAGGRLRRIWFEGSLAKIASAALLAEAPAPGLGGAALEPRIEGADWEFALDAKAWPRALSGDEGSWVLGLCCAARLGAGPGEQGSFESEAVYYRELEALPAADGLSLKCVGAAAAVTAFRALEAELGQEPARLYWSLDCRAAGVTVARQRGSVR
jgi:hypothetical protein